MDHPGHSAFLGFPQYAFIVAAAAPDNVGDIGEKAYDKVSANDRFSGDQSVVLNNALSFNEVGGGYWHGFIGQ